MTPIESIKSSLSLLDYAARFLEIKRGKAICFLHAEKTASLSIYKDYFYCHGCGAGGDVVKFAAAYHEISVGSAVRMLAAELGIPLSRQTKPHPYDAAKARRERMEAEEWKRSARRSLLASLHQDDYDRVLPFLERLESAPALAAYREQRTPEQAVLLRESIRETDMWVKAITPLVERLLTA